MKMTQITGVSYLGVAAYNAQGALVGTLHITNTIRPTSSFACSAIVYNGYNIVKNMLGSWFFLLGNLSFACGY